MHNQDVEVAAGDRDEETAAPGRVRAWRVPLQPFTGWPGALRVAAHLLAWLPFVVAGQLLIRQGWRPVSDAAAIALRSWDVLTAHGPLMGQATRLAQGVFDPGPLQYWLLTVPVHLDPGHGLLWGASLWCMVAASLAVEAAWSVARQAGALLASGVVLATVIWMPGVALQPYWNPWFGVMFLYAALAACCAVMAGRRGWWPVLVITASIAAQAHLMFAVISVALVVAAFAVGLADSLRTRAGYRWALAGLIAGAACWSAPIVQQLTGARGNLTAILHAQANQGHRTGLGFGLKALAAATEPPATWWRPLQSLLNLNLIDKRSAAFGAASLMVTVVIVVVALRLKSRPLAAFAGISLLLSIGALASYASLATAGIPAHPTSLDTLNYLLILLLPVGVIWWLTVGFALVLAVRQVPRRSRPSTSHRWAYGAGLWVAGVVAVALLAMAASLAPVRARRQFPAVADASVARAVRIASAEIERRLPRQPVVLSVAAPGVHYRKRRLLLGLAWVLVTKGYAPEVTDFGWELGPRYVERGGPVRQVEVLLRGSSVSIITNGASAAGRSRSGGSGRP